MYILVKNVLNIFIGEHMIYFQAQISFSENISQKRIQRAKKLFGEKLVIRIICLALFLLGGKRNDISQFLGIPKGSLFSFLTNFFNKGIQSFIDKRNRKKTFNDKRFILFDDGHKKNLMRDPVYKHIFKLFELYKIKWEIILGQKKGQTANHQKALKITDTDYIWRLDDDSISEPNVLETLLKHMRKGVGAAGSLVLNPQKKYKLPKEKPYNQIENIYTSPNIQWCEQPPAVHKVDHLYSTFLFRKEAATHGYCKELSIVGHREETIFTYEMKRAGWEIIVDSSVKIWDFQQPTGGTRLYDDREDLFEENERVFRKKLLEWDIKLNKNQK